MRIARLLRWVSLAGFLLILTGAIHGMHEMKRAGVIVCRALLFLVINAPFLSAEHVMWVSGVNVTASVGRVERTSGCDGCFDAGAVSRQTIVSGDGYIEFTVGNANALFVAGLGRGNDDTSIADIDFAFRFNGAGSADVLVNGIYRAGGDTPYTVGDVFRVAISGSKPSSRHSPRRTGAQLGGSTVSFTWSSVNGSGSYGLYVGSSRGAGDYYRREEFGTRATVTGLPTDGRLLYVSLWSRVEGGWKAREYVMRAASQ